MVVAFVGNTENYKQLYEEQQSVNAVLHADLTTTETQYNTQIKKSTELATKLQQELQNLEADNNRLASDLRQAQRLAQQYQNQADSWKGVMTGFEQSVRNLQASLSQTQEQLDQARNEGIKDKKELNQLTADLYEKIVQLQSLEAERRRLLEQKKELEEQTATGTIAPPQVTAVTPLNRTAAPVSPITTAADIKGLVVEVQQNLITLSVGSADGVRQDMVFHITRGERFICDVIITNVDINQCAGVLDLKVESPQVGDTASTQL